MTVGKDYWLITSEGKVISHQAFKSVRPWTDDFYVFTNNEGKQGLISKDGEIALTARFTEIKRPRDGIAMVVNQKIQKNPDGGIDVSSEFGYIDEHGKVIIEPGTFYGGGYSQFELEPFSEGLAPVCRKSDSWGYIDRTGAMIIPEQFISAGPFSEGLAAVCDYRHRCAYVDKTGTQIIPPNFSSATPFCRDRAWVKNAPYDRDKPLWAMIDRTGKVLTDFAYNPPEFQTTWIADEFFGDKNSSGKYSEADFLRKVRWRGNLAVINHGDFLNGLATADGKVLVEPIFNRINEFHDGVAVAVDSRGRDEKGNVTFATALLTERGEMLAYDKYTTVSDFDGGVAWATHRWTDHRGPYKNEGWGLIDTKAGELSELKYIKPGWIWGKGEKYTDNQSPVFYGELAPVALAEGYQPYGEKVWLLNSWGYMNRAGKIVVWHEKTTGK